MNSKHPVRAESFAILPEDDPVEPSVKLTGNADSLAAEPLDDYLASLHVRLRMHGIRSMHVDLTELYFMNSSCLKAFASWIYDVKKDGGPYRISLRTNSGLSWQRRSLKTLVRMAPDVVSLDDASI